MKILITGGLGYIGMELSRLYSGKSRKNDITVIDKNFFSGRVTQLKKWGIGYVQGDILDKEFIKKHLDNADIVYHLAGITDVGNTLNDINKKRDNEVKKVGIEGTRNIIKFSENKSKIVFPSTHVVHEGVKDLIKDIDEDFQPLPVLEYAKGKYVSEQDLISSNKNYIILRLGSVYGNNGDPTRINIMPNLFSKITSESGTIKLYSKGKQLKCLVSVKDVARCMEFTGESKNINSEIFNVVNENLTVKEVASICKKINKKLDIIETSDEVPNKGYSLSNKKIKKTGFKFLYNFKNLAEEFLEDLRTEDLKDINEYLVKGTDDFIDERGIISNYYFDNEINMIGYVESLKGSIRGNHYHPIQTQKCLLIRGRYVSVTKDLLNPHSVIETRLVSQGELSTIPPNVAHTMVFLEDSIFLNLVDGEREHSNYGITHTLKYELVKDELAKILLNFYKTECRVCGEGLNHYLSLGLSPLANNLNGKKNISNELYPLDLNFCNVCSNSQLSIAVPPEKMFTDYVYLSSTSSKFKKHFVDTAKEFKRELNLTKSSVVIDIGSNDGIFLEPLDKLGIKCVGVEPAKNIAKISKSKGLNTLNEYFDNNTVKKIKKQYGKADLVTAFNVFAHNDGLREILINIEELLKNDGDFVFEIQYLLRTIKDLTFDNIYHEHVNYWCLLSIMHFFQNSSLKVYKVKEVDTHGGSLRVYVSKNKNKRVDKSVAKYIDLEKRNKLDKIETYQNFSNEVEKVKNKSIKKINKILEKDKSIVGYGAPAKATTILNYFGLNDHHFKFVIEDSIQKHDKFIPGTNIKIVSKDVINNKNIDYVLVLAWNFFEQIVRDNTNNFPKSEFIKLK